MDDRLSIILSPHFDDAVLSLGGFIATAPERAVIVTVFAGTPAEGIAGRWDRWSGFKSAAEAMRARALENEAALAVLGVPPNGILNLGFLDRQYRPHETASPALEPVIAETVRRLAVRPGGPIDVFCPISPWHPDHRAVTDAVVALRKARELQGAAVLLYQDQPYAYLELRRRTLAPLRLVSFSTMGNARGVSAQPHSLEFDDMAAAKKRQAIGRYKSQFPLVRPLLCKMIADFSRYQARAAGLFSRHAEIVYHLDPPAHS